jgi:hypothetical protein
MPREIMTIQLGGYSNFLGSHFWNIQEECMSYDDDDDESRENSEVRHDILWRTTRETVVPRLMTLDLKSERGALRRRGYLYPDEEPAAAGGAAASVAADIAVDMGAWGGQVASYYSEPVAVHPFVQHLLDTDAQEYEEYSEEAEVGNEGGGVGAGERGGGWDGDDGDEAGEGGAHNEGQADGGEEKKESKPDFVIEDETVRYWSDFLKVSFHPRTCHDLTQGFGIGTNSQKYSIIVNFI